MFQLYESSSLSGPLFSPPMEVPFCWMTTLVSLLPFTLSPPSVSVEIVSSCWLIGGLLNGVDTLGEEFEFLCQSGMLAPPLPIGPGEAGNWWRFRRRPLRVATSSLSCRKGWPVFCWARDVCSPVTWAVSSCTCCCCSDNSAWNQIKSQYNYLYIMQAFG